MILHKGAWTLGRRACASDEATDATHHQTQSWISWGILLRVKVCRLVALRSPNPVSFRIRAQHPFPRTLPSHSLPMYILSAVDRLKSASEDPARSYLRAPAMALVLIAQDAAFQPARAALPLFTPTPPPTSRRSSSPASLVSLN